MFWNKVGNQFWNKVVQSSWSPLFLLIQSGAWHSWILDLVYFLIFIRISQENHTNYFHSTQLLLNPETVRMLACMYDQQQTVTNDFWRSKPTFRGPKWLLEGSKRLFGLKMTFGGSKWLFGISNAFWGFKMSFRG